MPFALLIVACVMFGLGAFSRWWVLDRPWYPAFTNIGLFCWVLSILWPQLFK